MNVQSSTLEPSIDRHQPKIRHHSPPIKPYIVFHHGRKTTEKQKSNDLPGPGSRFRLFAADDARRFERRRRLGVDVREVQHLRRLDAGVLGGGGRRQPRTSLPVELADAASCRFDNKKTTMSLYVLCLDIFCFVSFFSVKKKFVGTSIGVGI